MECINFLKNNFCLEEKKKKKKFNVEPRGGKWVAKELVCRPQ